MKSIGIYPGTFDPVHDGHLAFAKTAVESCGLDAVCFIPELNPRVKNDVRPLSERVLIIRRALRETPELHVVTLSSDQFTVHETLPEIESLLGPASFTLLIGSDVAITLDKWPECDRLLTTWDIAIGMRHNDDPSDIDTVLKRIEHTHQLQIRRTFIRTDKASISSSQLRDAPK